MLFELFTISMYVYITRKKQYSYLQLRGSLLFKLKKNSSFNSILKDHKHPHQDKGEEVTVYWSELKKINYKVNIC